MKINQWVDYLNNVEWYHRPSLLFSKQDNIVVVHWSSATKHETNSQGLFLLQGLVDGIEGATELCQKWLGGKENQETCFVRYNRVDQPGMNQDRHNRQTLCKITTLIGEVPNVHHLRWSTLVNQRVWLLNLMDP